MKPSLGSPDFLFTFGFTFRKPTDTIVTILLSISETAISNLFRKSNVFFKSSMVLRTFNAVFKLSYETIMLFDCSGFSPPHFAIITVKWDKCRNCVNIGYSYFSYTAIRMFLDWFTIKYTRFGTTPCINLYPTIACAVCKNGNRKTNDIASYSMKKFWIEYQWFLLLFCTHRNKFNCVF